MLNRRLLSAAITASCLAVGTAAHAADAPSGPTFEARLRSESVDDQAFAYSADATTLRLRLGYRTPTRSAWSGFVEIENTSHLFGERFNSTANGRTAYPTVADPD